MPSLAPPPAPLDPASLRAVEARLRDARAVGGRWARLEDAELLATALREAWDRWPQSRPPVPYGDTVGNGRTLSSAFGGRSWDVMRVPEAMAEAGGDVEVAAVALRVLPRELRAFLREFYPCRRRRDWLPPPPET